MVQGLDDG
jgi:hypothetical protein